ncbi:hypothetical protein EAG_01087 [Camponotus floridanus]|uniref:Uncharacterized protein n=1 Tax=Camponotus floridanus TaxID=104421 RepID=E2AB71_CAMFO|nr:hypothetical protein EAG_01087 [Camponotus floridanus]
MTNSVPDRWLEYKPFGNVIKGTNILAFKVPLKDVSISVNNSLILIILHIF